MGAVACDAGEVALHHVHAPAPCPARSVRRAGHAAQVGQDITGRPGWAVGVRGAGRETEVRVLVSGGGAAEVAGRAIALLTAHFLRAAAGAHGADADAPTDRAVLVGARRAKRHRADLHAVDVSLVAPDMVALETRAARLASLLLLLARTDSRAVLAVTAARAPAAGRRELTRYRSLADAAVALGVECPEARGQVRMAVIKAAPGRAASVDATGWAVAEWVDAVVV